MIHVRIEHSHVAGILEGHGMSTWGEDLVNGMRARQRDRELEPVLEGYSAAADISLGILTASLDRIEAKLEAGESLTADEKVMRTELHAIRYRIERKLQDHWKLAYGA